MTQVCQARFAGDVVTIQPAEYLVLQLADKDAHVQKELHGGWIRVDIVRSNQ